MHHVKEHARFCAQGGTYALGNQNNAPDAAHPVYLANSTVDNSVAVGALFYLTGPNPAWRNPSDCGHQVRSR